MDCREVPEERVEECVRACVGATFVCGERDGVVADLVRAAADLLTECDRLQLYRVDSLEAPVLSLRSRLWDVVGRFALEVEPACES